MKPNKAETRQQYQEAAAFYAQQLRDSPGVEFLKSRKITGETAQSFHLGFVAEPYVDDHKHMVGRLAIPNITVDPSGREIVVDLKFRLLEEEKSGSPKFLSPPKAGPVRLYNLRALRSARNVLAVTEGQSDCWTVSQAGIPAIAVPGVGNWGEPSSYRKRILSGFSRVILCRDSDDAGKGLERALNEVDGLEVCNPGPFKDVSEFFIERGEDALRQLILGDQK